METTTQDRCPSCAVPMTDPPTSDDCPIADEHGHGPGCDGPLNCTCQTCPWTDADECASAAEREVAGTDGAMRHCDTHRPANDHKHLFRWWVGSTDETLQTSLAEYVAKLDTFDGEMREFMSGVIDGLRAELAYRGHLCQHPGCRLLATHRSGFANTDVQDLCVPHTNARENDGACGRSILPIGPAR